MPPKIRIRTFCKTYISLMKSKVIEITNLLQCKEKDGQNRMVNKKEW